MRKPSYSDRCIQKASFLIEEVLDDYSLGHIYKTIVGFWEIVELLLRAIIYIKKKTTYEKPRKLINEYVKIAKLPKGVPASINTLYELRKKTVHKPSILTKKNIEEAKKAFCDVIRELTKEIPRGRIPELERIKELCQGI